MKNLLFSKNILARFDTLVDLKSASMLADLGPSYHRSIYLSINGDMLLFVSTDNYHIAIKRGLVRVQNTYFIANMTCMIDQIIKGCAATLVIGIHCDKSAKI